MSFIDSCSNTSVLPMFIGSPVFHPDNMLLGYLEIRKQESFNSNDSKKNKMSGMRSSPSQFLRPQKTLGARSFMRRYPDLFGDGSTPCGLSEMPESETGALRFSFRQSVLYETFCDIHWQAVSNVDHSRCGQRIPFGLEDSQRS